MDRLHSILDLASSARYLEASRLFSLFLADIHPSPSLAFSLSDFLDNDLSVLIEYSFPSFGDTDADLALMHVLNKVDENKYVLKQMVDRAEEILKTIANEEKVEDGGDEVMTDWVYGSSYYGITTYYQVHSDSSIHVRISGNLKDLPIFEQCLTIHEINFFKTWIPFCPISMLLEKLEAAELLMYVNISVPYIISRDTCLHAYGADCLFEHDKILLIGNSVAHNTQHIQEKDQKGIEGIRDPLEESKRCNMTLPFLDEKNLKNKSLKTNTECIWENLTSKCLRATATDDDYTCPWIPARWNHCEVDIQEFKALITTVSPQEANTTIIIKLNPKIALPRSIINFVVKNLAGVVLIFFQRHAKKIKEMPHVPPTTHSRSTQKGKDDKYAAFYNCNSKDQELYRSLYMGINKDRAFYMQWLFPKIQAYCAYKGWEPLELPPYLQPNA